ncbi:Protein DVR-1 [Toxocara canis]|uniref:Protein DVR-1 n=2 Tax=Toxocara canis TaxID=6265 RepID=A0A0B2VVP2_TOXCA|nr:Protein DVR-1 [Toxocara canis]VDM45336.1 unnamed protein product [Toxocara canis]
MLLCALVLAALSVTSHLMTFNEEVERSRRLNAEKQRLLEKLGIGEKLPHVDISKLAVNKHVVNTDDEIADAEEERIVIANSPDDPHCISLAGEVIPNCFHFDIDSRIDFVVSAALVLTLSGDTNGEIVQLSEIEPITQILQILKTERITANAGDTIQFDITSAVRDWIREKQTGHTVQLARCGLCNKRDGCVLCRGEQFIDTNNEVSPIIQISLPRSVPTRRRRSSSCPPDGSCCLHHMYVNFTEIGFNDFIIAPTGYQANYCAGRCTKHENAHGHRRMLQIIHEPCCAPTKYDPLEVVYAISENDLRKRLLHGMKVSECGCLA